MNLWSWFRGLFSAKQPEQRMMSFVLLLREERYLDTQILRRLATNAFQIECSGSDNYVLNLRPKVDYLVRARGEAFLLVNHPQPYVENVAKISQEIDEVRFRKAFVEHRAWMSIDRVGPAVMSDAEALHWMGRLAAELLDGDCTAIYCPTNGQGCVNDGSVESLLRSDQPLEIFQNFRRNPVIDISNDDPALRRAVRQARQCWPQFVLAFENRHDHEGAFFSVKAPITDGESVEYMWISVGALENGLIFGKIDNDPFNLRGIKTGDRVRIPVGELSDWLYCSGEQQCGGFTVAILIDRQRRRDKT